MRLREVDVHLVDIPFREAVQSGAHRWQRRRAGIVVLRTGEGHEGLGEYAAPAPGDLGADVAPRLRQVLAGVHLADPLAVEGALREVDGWAFVGRAARSAVESALVDLLARVGGRSVAAFLGSRPARQVDLNATLGMTDTGLAVERAKEQVAAGYGCLKLKAGDEPGGQLRERLAAVREAVGPEVALRVDFNGSLSVRRAQQVLAALADLDLEYAEQPIAASAGWEALAHLRWTSPLPIAADESVRDVGSARALLEAAAVDVLVVKPSRVGGLRQASAIVDRATTAGVPVTVSTMFETGVGIAGALHLASVEPAGGAHGLATAELLASDLLARPLAIEAGRMAVPDGPGLGIRLDPDALERYRVA